MFDPISKELVLKAELQSYGGHAARAAHARHYRLPYTIINTLVEHTNWDKIPSRVSPNPRGGGARVREKMVWGNISTRPPAYYDASAARRLHSTFPNRREKNCFEIR